MMTINILRNAILCLFAFLPTLSVCASQPISLKNTFNPDEVSWVKKKGSASIQGEAYIKLADGTYKGCAGFNIELLPVADYSNERIYKTYGNNKIGQILLSENPPKFTPDAKKYHELVLKTQCNAEHKFSFTNVHPGNYYVMAFIIWDKLQGGGVMKRVTLTEGDKTTAVVKIE